MTYYRITPHPVLRPFVESLGIQESDDVSTNTTCVLPTTCTEMLFHYRDRFIQHHTDGVSPEPLSYLCGQRTRPLRVSATGRTGIVVASFYPCALPAFVNMPASEFTDLCVPLSDLFCPSLVEETQDKIFLAKNTQDRITAVESLLINMLTTRNIDRRVVCAVNRVNRTMGSERIDGLAWSLDISTRQLNRKFLQIVGISPKKFAAINRFQKALFLKQSGATTQDVLTRTGYYDQAHFIHDFQQYGDESPELIFSRGQDSLLMQHFNPIHHNNGMTHFYNTLYLQ